MKLGRPNISLQRTAIRWLAAAELGSLGTLFTVNTGGTK